MTQTIIYIIIGAGAALTVMFVLRLIRGGEKKSKVYSMGKERPFAQATELFDPTLNTKSTKSKIRSAASDISMVKEIIPMLEKGHKIEAIKYVHERHKEMGLAEAKLFVEEAEDLMHKMPKLFNFEEGSKEVFNSSPSDLDNRLIQIITGGSLIEAIKVYREANNISLLEAKEYCENLVKTHNIKL